MASAHSEPPDTSASPAPADRAPAIGAIADELIALKLVIAGGFGVGKTTLVSAVSEVRPLQTEEAMTRPSEAVDNVSGVELKSTTTVAMDYGRITIRDGLCLYLFGTPGQDRFWFMWDELTAGALGAVVLADTRRLDDCFPAVDYFESRKVPFVIGVNCFDGSRRYTDKSVSRALDLEPDTPVVMCDARDRESVKALLISIVEHAGERYAVPVPAAMHHDG